ncbi:hypothetical protein EYF80_027295 [Liparis tanakae]|uniref:Uncharacterized protein n=1 Tax=Liparis tanakae TaxID=230148 RepID=A0A4Z2HCJ1_9TELE|nr:hypothetical protein EYF80_027295 [Liparis tanakae]
MSPCKSPLTLIEETAHGSRCSTAASEGECAVCLSACEGRLVPTARSGEGEAVWYFLIQFKGARRRGSSHSCQHCCSSHVSIGYRLAVPITQWLPAESSVSSSDSSVQSSCWLSGTPGLPVKAGVLLTHGNSPLRGRLTVGHLISIAKWPIYLRHHRCSLPREPSLVFRRRRPRGEHLLRFAAQVPNVRSAKLKGATDGITARPQESGQTSQTSKATECFNIFVVNSR